MVTSELNSKINVLPFKFFGNLLSIRLNHCVEILELSKFINKVLSFLWIVFCEISENRYKDPSLIIYLDQSDPEVKLVSESPPPVNEDGNIVYNEYVPSKFPEINLDGKLAKLLSVNEILGHFVLYMLLVSVKYPFPCNFANNPLPEQALLLHTTLELSNIARFACTEYPSLT